MLKSLGTRLHHLFRLHPILVLIVCLSFGITVLLLLSSVYTNYFPSAATYKNKNDLDNDVYPFANLKNLVMVAGHSVYTSSNCGKTDGEMMSLCFCLVEERLEKKLDLAVKLRVIGLLLNPKDGKDDVRSRALTEEHARDCFENLLFSVCRFRELTGSYPRNITVVSYDFKEERFAHLHRSAMGFPDIHYDITIK